MVTSNAENSADNNAERRVSEATHKRQVNTLQLAADVRSSIWARLQDIDGVESLQSILAHVQTLILPEMPKSTSNCDNGWQVDGC